MSLFRSHHATIEIVWVTIIWFLFHISNLTIQRTKRKLFIGLFHRIMWKRSWLQDVWYLAARQWVPDPDLWPEERLRQHHHLGQSELSLRAGAHHGPMWHFYEVGVEFVEGGDAILCVLGAPIGSADAGDGGKESDAVPAFWSLWHLLHRPITRPQPSPGPIRDLRRHDPRWPHRQSHSACLHLPRREDQLQ